jgi:hypothetical protein
MLYNNDVMHKINQIIKTNNEINKNIKKNNTSVSFGPLKCLIVSFYILGKATSLVVQHLK